MRGISPRLRLESGPLGHTERRKMCLLWNSRQNGTPSSAAAKTLILFC